MGCAGECAEPHAESPKGSYFIRNRSRWRSRMRIVLRRDLSARAIPFLPRCAKRCVECAPRKVRWSCTRQGPAATVGCATCASKVVSTIRFEHPAQELAFNEYRSASKEACERVERITEALRVQCEEWRMNPVVKALMCLNAYSDSSWTGIPGQRGH